MNRSRHFFTLKFIIFYIFILFPSILNARHVIVLDEPYNAREFHFRTGNIEVFVDSTNVLTFENVKNAKFNSVNYSPLAANEDPTLTYWVKFSFLNYTQEDRWVLELYDFRINHFELYLEKEGDGYERYEGGDQFSFYKKSFLHKNFPFHFSIPKGEERQVYLRIYPGNQIGIIGVVRSFERFLHYATVEYSLLALFYGILIALAFYNLFLLISVRDKVYLYYVFFILSMIFYALCQDGLGFQFIWPEHPHLNEIIPAVSLLSSVVFLLLYTKEFLVLKVNSPVLDKVFTMLICVRILFFVLGESYFPEKFGALFSYFDFVILVVVFVAGLNVFYFKNYKAARFYLLAFTFFYIGFTIFCLDRLRLISGWVYFAYSLNAGVALQSILLSLALADKIKFIIKEKEQAQQQMIFQLNENQELKDRVNKELESLVEERTRNLDTFVYKASHDIKGPLKSIIGLTTVGIKDVSDVKAKEYFEHILKSASKLDALVADLLLMTRIQQKLVEPVKIDFNKIINETIGMFTNDKVNSDVIFNFDVCDQGHYYGDYILVYSIVQNLIENSIKYRDPVKKHHEVNVVVKSDDKNTYFSVEDNGVGIDEEHKDKIFQMFYKIDTSVSGTGLGLHIVKTALEKLNGTINVKSKKGEGTKFEVYL